MVERDGNHGNPRKRQGISPPVPHRSLTRLSGQVPCGHLDTARRCPAVVATGPETPAHLAVPPQGRTWAEIAELVGNRSARVLADTYTHVLMDEREIDYERVIAERLRTPAAQLRVA